MISNETATAFVQQWLGAFNAHNVDLILEHYADDLEFRSPFIPLLTSNSDGVIRSKPELKRYFEHALKTYPDLHFTLHEFYTGIDTVVIRYQSVGGRIAAEVFQLNEEGKASRVYCNYATVVAKQ